MRGLLLVVYHGLVLMCRFGPLNVVHGTHGHRRSALLPGPSCGTRSLLPADVNDPKDDECQKHDGVESHNSDHNGEQSVEPVQNSVGGADTIRCSTNDLRRGDIISNVGSRLGSSDPSEIRRSFVWIDQRKEFDERIAHCTCTVEVSEIVDRIDSTKGVVTNQPIARLEVRMRWSECVGRRVSQLTIADGNLLRNERTSARLVVNFGVDRHV